MGSESGIPFGNYTLLKRIARGGMAEVFVARQKGIDGFDRLVAIKRILPHLLDDKSFVRMFQEEARLAARLSHPNVIHIYDFGKVAEHFFIAMEFMHGVHTGELIRMAGQEMLPAALVARIGADACAGLHYAHNRSNESGEPLQLVHRDISPPNLLVSFDGVVKIVDFGIAKAVSSIEQTRPGVVKGKYAYMSPEQTMGQQLDGRSDVFSLAMVMWELLAGEPAVTRNDQIMAMKAIRDGRVPRIEDHREGLAPALCSAMANALHKDPKQRSDARAFGNELEAFIKASNQIATSMELGAWLGMRVPREDLGVDGPGSGTRQATSLGTQQATPQEDLRFEAPEAVREPGTRGSVVARLSPENQETRVLSVASGDLRTAESGHFRPMSDGHSVVIDSDIVEGGFRDESDSDEPLALAMPTATTRLLDSGVVLGNGAGPSQVDFDNDEETRMDPRHGQQPADLYTHTIATIESGEALTVDGGGPHGSQLLSDLYQGNAPLEPETESPTTEVEDPPFAGVMHSAPLPMGQPFIPTPPQGYPAPFQARNHEVPEQAPSVRPPVRYPRVLIAGMLVAIVAVIVMIRNSSEKPSARGGSAADADALLAMQPGAEGDAGSRVPTIVVTPLWDAGSAKKETAVLEITTRPSRALVKINGIARGTSPASFSGLEPGEIEVLIELDGYLPETRKVKLKPNQYRSLELALRAAPSETPPDDSPPKNNRPVKAQPGLLAVRTSPYSIVYHRNKKLGVTPLANLQLDPGRYKLTFKNPDRKPVTRNVVIKSGKTTKLDFDLN